LFGYWRVEYHFAAEFTKLKHWREFRQVLVLEDASILEFQIIESDNTGYNHVQNP